MIQFINKLEFKKIDEYDLVSSAAQAGSINLISNPMFGLYRLK